MSSIPSLNIGSSGAIPTPPATLNQNLIDYVEATNPDYTANLPGILIEDVSSTITGSMFFIDQARVDAVNALTSPVMAPYILSQLGQQNGIPQGQPSNTSAYVVFTGSQGYLIQQGLLVSDGTHQYAVQSASILGSGGVSSPVFVVATSSGIWTPGTNTITTIVTSLPTGVSLTVTNPTTGTAGGSSETVASYRGRILESQIVTGQGVPTFLKTLLSNIPGVNPRLVSIIAVAGGWEVICGGGDPNLIAGAIYLSTIDLSTILGSQTTSYNITATIIDPPNSYNATFVDPPAQTVTMIATWNTTLAGFTNVPIVNQQATVALISYLNSIPVGQPINELEMSAVFQDAILSILPEAYLTTLTFQVSVNGVVTPPTTGTSIIPSPVLEGYWSASATAVSVVQG